MDEPARGSARWLGPARAGSAEALGRLLEEFRGYLLTVARQQLDPGLGPKVSPSDVVQQTFLEAQRDFRHFHGDTDEELKAWLRRLLQHNLADMTRRYRGTGKRDAAREVRLPPD